MSVPPPQNHVSDGKQAMNGKWSTDLMDCFNDWGVCLLVCCPAPCYVYGYNVVKMKGFQGGHCCFQWYGACHAYSTLLCCMWSVGAWTRKEIREKYGIAAESDWEDCVAHIWPITYLAVCQEARELKHRGVW